MTLRDFFRPMFPAWIRPVPVVDLINEEEYDAKKRFLQHSLNAIRSKALAAGEEEAAQFLEHYKNI